MFTLPRLVVLAPFIGLKKKVKYALLLVFFAVSLAHREFETPLTWLTFVFFTAFTWSFWLIPYVPAFTHDGGPINSRFHDVPSSAGFQVSHLLLGHFLVLGGLFMLFGGWLGSALMVTASVVIFACLIPLYLSQYFRVWEISE